MKPQGIEIQELVKMYLGEQILLPEMQRKYVWNSTKVRNLFDSIYRDYPSGSILMWKAGEAPETKQAALSTEDKKPYNQKLYLLDGQQRITSLATVIAGDPIRTKGEGDQIISRKIELYFNLEHPDKLDIEMDDLSSSDEDSLNSRNDDARSRFFQVKNSKIENRPEWIPVTQLFKEGTGSILKDLKVSYDHPKYELYNSRLSKLYSRMENYVYPVQILPEELSYQEATDVFIRVNSLGTRLSGPDLALALVTSRWPGSMALFDEFGIQCSKYNFQLEAGFLIRCVVALATGQSRFDTIGKIPIQKIRESWESIKLGLDYAINFVRTAAKLETSSVLPSPYVLIPLAVYAARNDLKFGKEHTDLLRWFYAASMWGHYARGSSETILDQDLKSLDSEHPGQSLINNIMQQIGRTQVKEEDLEGKNPNSSFFMMMYVLALRNSAIDWGTGLPFSQTHLGKGYKVTLDHIFPRAKLTKFLEDKYGQQGDKKTITSLVNDMANIAFLSEKENPRKAERLPPEYLARIRREYGDIALSAQYVPLNEQIWGMDKYEQFLATRRKMIADAINKLMDELSQGTPISLVSKMSTKELVAKGEGQFVEFKSSLRWDLKTKMVNSSLSYAAMKVLDAFLNSDGGTLLVGVENNGNVIGLENDMASFEVSKQNLDGFELYLTGTLKNYLGMEAMPFLHWVFDDVEGKKVARIEVDRSTMPVYLRNNDKKEFQVKLGNSCQPLDVEQTVKYIQKHWPIAGVSSFP